MGGNKRLLPRLRRFLATWKGFLAIMGLGCLALMFEAHAVNSVSSPTARDIFNARGFHNNPSLWADSRSREMAANYSTTYTRRARHKNDEKGLMDALDALAKKDPNLAAQIRSAYLAKAGELSVADSVSALTETRDIMHNLWFKYCFRPDRTRICGPESILRKYIDFQTPPAVFVVYLSFMGFLASLSLGNFAIINHILLTIILSRFFRVMTFTSTTLGPINPNCRVIFTNASEAGGCGDLLFSGHGVVITVALCFMWTSTQPRLPRILCLLATVAGIHSMWASSVERFHYTADMVLAVVVTALVFVVVDRVTLYLTYQSLHDIAPASANRSRVDAYKDCAGGNGDNGDAREASGDTCRRRHSTERGERAEDGASDDSDRKHSAIAERLGDDIYSSLAAGACSTHPILLRHCVLATMYAASMLLALVVFGTPT